MEAEAVDVSAYPALQTSQLAIQQYIALLLLQSPLCTANVLCSLRLSVSTRASNVLSNLLCTVLATVDMPTLWLLWQRLNDNDTEANEEVVEPKVAASVENMVAAIKHVSVRIEIGESLI